MSTKTEQIRAEKEEIIQSIDQRLNRLKTALKQKLEPKPT